jgi:predicted transcriptional regulator
MASLKIRDELARKLEEIARRENRPVDEVIESLIKQYGTSIGSTRQVRDDEAAHQAALEELRPKLYRMAREYWREVGNEERLALTDEQLDEQFWLFDHEGIPRLKSDRDSVALPPDPLEAIAGMFETGPADLSTSVRETLARYTHPQYGWTRRGRSD